MKRIVSALLAVALVASLCGCGAAPAGTTSQSAGGSSAAQTSQPSGEGTTIKLLNGKIEIDQQLRDYAAAYEQEYGVRVEVESVAGADVTTYLTSYLVSGEMPDIFYFGGESDYQILKEHMADLSGESWVSHTTATFEGENGETVGFPYAVEGIGMVYNGDILEQAGIDPATLTTIDAYRAAFETLESKKDELGIDAPVSLAASIAAGCSWITGMHQTGVYLGQGLAQEDDSLLQLMFEGKVDKERLDQYAEWEALLCQYADPYVLQSGSYDEQIALWATGKTAFICQGNWIDPSIAAYDITFPCGMAPLAFDEEETDGVISFPPSWWAIYKDTANMDACKEFLENIAFTEAGQQCLVVDCGMVSPFDFCEIAPETPLAVSLMDWVSAGKTYPWYANAMPSGMDESIAAIYELMANGTIDAQGFSDQVESLVAGES